MSGHLRKNTGAENRILAVAERDKKEKESLPSLDSKGQVSSTACTTPGRFSLTDSAEKSVKSSRRKKIFSPLVSSGAG